MAISLFVLFLVATFAPLAIPPAGAVPGQDEVDDAYSRAEQLVDEVRAAQAELESLSTQIAAVAEAIAEQEGEVERITVEIQDVQREVSQRQREVAAISEQLNERVAQAFMSQGSQLSALLSASSITELSDSIEFMGAISRRDASLANRISNAKTQLQYRVDELSKVREQERQALDRIRADEASLQEQLSRQQTLLQEIEDKRAEAHRYAEHLDQERQDYLESQLPDPTSTTPATDGGGGDMSGVFQACPVDQPRIVTDSFGAPRYVGGYHPHAGDDIMAPAGTVIRAPFDGVARDASNQIGGIAVIVQGSGGWVYNAHMSSIGSLGAVQAGDVIGYVGMTGASGAGVNHNHFEYHPNATPSSWPESSYGYSVIGDAVNPYPVLQTVC